MRLIVFILAFASTSAFAGLNLKQEALLFTKIKFEQKAFDLKLSKERELVKISNKENLKFLDNNFDYDSECVAFVYKGSASREESVLACQGVLSMECVEFVYKGAASREESAKACRGVTDMDCVNFIYQGSASREEAARSCVGGGHGRPDHGC